MDKCYTQYKLLTANDEPSRNGNILDIKSANGNFKNVANHLQVMFKFKLYPNPNPKYKLLIHVKA